MSFALSLSLSKYIYLSLFFSKYTHCFHLSHERLNWCKLIRREKEEEKRKLTSTQATDIHWKANAQQRENIQKWRKNIVRIRTFHQQNGDNNSTSSIEYINVSRNEMQKKWKCSYFVCFRSTTQKERKGKKKVRKRPNKNK